MNFKNGLSRRLALIVGVLCLAIPTGAEIAAQGLNPIKFSAKADPSALKPGQKTRITLTAEIDPSWHLYSLTQPPGGPRPTRIVIAEESPVVLVGNPRQPRPRVAPDPNFSTPGQPPFMTETFEERVEFTLDAEVKSDAPGGSGKAILKVSFQACDDHQCLPPRTRPVEVDLTITGGAPAPVESGKPGSDTLVGLINAASQQAPPPAGTTGAESSAPAPTTAAAGAAAATDEGPADPRSRGLAGYILFAMSVGLLSLLTPCVFPMIPITVSFFTKKEQRSTGEAVRQALLYCLGIILTFTGLGLALTAVAGPAGINRLAASPWMNIFLTTLFVVFALNLFGLFEISLPGAMLNRLDRLTRSGTTIATLLMGLTFTLTSFTCTAAFVGTVLVAVTQGEWFWPAVGMLSFSTAFALPFFLLAVFPKYLQSLPRSGGWLNSVKVVMGFLELGAAFKFLSNVDLVWGWETISRNLVLAAWIAICLITTLYLLGKFLLPHDSPVTSLSVGRMLAATFFLGLALFFLTGLFGGNLGEWEAMLPPARATAPTGAPTSGSATAPRWLEDYDQALALARREDRPVFINFTGVTCTNCRWMESNMFTQPEVEQALTSFVRVELFTDRETPGDIRNGELQAQKFQTVALPLYAIVDSAGNTLASFAGLTRDKAEFLEFINRGASRLNPTNSL
ncbi:MAG: protein-disulfide reductase DsbD family protein [Blastocatellia bacterium]